MWVGLCWSGSSDYSMHFCAPPAHPPPRLPAPKKCVCVCALLISVGLTQSRVHEFAPSLFVTHRRGRRGQAYCCWSEGFGGGMKKCNHDVLK